MPESPHNPYAAIEPESHPVNADYLAPQDAGMVRQVPILATLQIIIGVLELMIGAGMIGMGFFMGYAMRMEDAQGVEPPPEAFIISMQVFYWVLGGAVFFFAVMRIGSGAMAFKFRGRGWMLASAIGGLLSVFTCYCAPFAAGIFVYAMIVLLNPTVAKAFAMGAEGMSPDQIRNQLLYGPPPLGPQDSLG